MLPPYPHSAQALGTAQDISVPHLCRARGWTQNAPWMLCRKAGGQQEGQGGGEHTPKGC